MFANAILPAENLTAMINAACDGDWTQDRLQETGERIWNLERRFNLEAGFSGADDRLPERTVLEAARGGAADGEVADLSVMLSEYYQLRGWNAKGEPLAETLARLGL